MKRSLFAELPQRGRWVPFLRRLGKAPEQLAKIEFRVTLPAAEGVTAGGGTNR